MHPDLRSREAQLEEIVQGMELEIHVLKDSLKRAMEESKQMKNINKELLD